MPASLLAEAQGDILRTLVGMMDQAGARPAALHGHLERGDDELGAHVVGHAPADDAAAVGVLDGGEIEPALPGAQVGDVGNPGPAHYVGNEPRLRRVKARYDPHDVFGAGGSIAPSAPAAPPIG